MDNKFKLIDKLETTYVNHYKKFNREIEKILINENTLEDLDIELSQLISCWKIKKTLSGGKFTYKGVPVKIDNSLIDNQIIAIG